MLWIVAGFATPGEALAATRMAAAALAVLVAVHLAAVFAFGLPSPVWPATTAWLGTIAPISVAVGAAAPALPFGPADVGAAGALGAAALVGAFFALATWALWEAGRVAAVVLAATAAAEVWQAVGSARGALSLTPFADAVSDPLPVVRGVAAAVLAVTALVALRGSFGADDRLD